MKNCVLLSNNVVHRTRLDAGMIDNFRLVNCLLDAGFDGPWCLEFPACGDRNHACGCDLAYFRQLYDESCSYSAACTGNEQGVNHATGNQVRHILPLR